MAPNYSGHPAGAAGGSGVDFQRPLHCRVSGFVQSCAAPNCQSSANPRGGIPPQLRCLSITKAAKALLSFMGALLKLSIATSAMEISVRTADLNAVSIWGL